MVDDSDDDYDNDGDDSDMDDMLMVIDNLIMRVFV